jgi:energy-coupling factor transporter ATP-binding protein EcfA2
MVLVVTHDARLMAYADRVHHMEDGRLATEGAPSRPPAHEPHLLPLPVHGRRLSLHELHEATA